MAKKLVQIFFFFLRGLLEIGRRVSNSRAHSTVPLVIIFILRPWILILFFVFFFILICTKEQHYPLIEQFFFFFFDDNCEIIERPVRS